MRMNFNVFHYDSPHVLTHYLYNVGHGDCLLMTDGDRSNLLVDVGSWKLTKHLDVPAHLSKKLPGEYNALMISHYHTDHYNMINRISGYAKLFKIMYVPDLPFSGPGSQLAEFIRVFVELALHTNYSFYWQLPVVLKNSGIPIIPLHEGMKFSEVGHRFKTLWPDLYSQLFVDEDVIAKSQECLSRLYGAVEDIRIDYSFYYGENMKGFFRHLAEISSPRTSRPYHEDIHKVLRSVERSFSEVANLFSLVVSSYYRKTDRMLLLGDATNDVLDTIKIPGGNEFNLIKSSHHGSFFGGSLAKLSTEYLTISRSKRDYPRITMIHPNYFTYLNSKCILSTEHLGHNLIV